MKIAHVGDIHWGLNYPGPTPEARFQDICRTMDWVADQIINEDCDLVLVAGDAFKDARVFLDRASVEISAFVAWLRKLTAAGIEVIVISGTPSHDAIAAYRLIQEMQLPRVTICTEPEVIHHDFVSIACLPGMNRSGVVTQEEFKGMAPHEIHAMMTERITATCRQMWESCNSPAILLGHLTYDMADKGFEDVLMQHEPVLTPEAIESFDLVALGHIHRPQQNGNVFYCGSPERLSFNDEGIDSGFWIHKWDEEVFISEFIDTPARRFRTITWDELLVRNFMKDTEFISSFYERFDGQIIRLHYSCPDELNKQLDRKRIEKALYDAGAFFVSEIKADIHRQDRARDQEVTESLGPIEALAKWAEQQGISQEEVIELQSMAAGLLEEVAV
ncbi:metallophosphoesterase family protein [Desulforamulus aquiferis]|uniref:Nuclease SbcCD subunit D n=1 Tax=Desulforamulus aquiferis TaxID=1397668 RepID=A0AAW7ZIY5_9FIRM|nr:exonuclease subunit SbcD [Desulforamulus aquiferis]MDO7789132.1 exonuclease subunit SbcD [Desulforamulus aquiferis]